MEIIKAFLKRFFDKRKKEKERLSRIKNQNIYMFAAIRDIKKEQEQKQRDIGE